MSRHASASVNAPATPSMACHSTALTCMRIHTHTHTHITHNTHTHTHTPHAHTHTHHMRTQTHVCADIQTHHTSWLGEAHSYKCRAIGSVTVNDLTLLVEQETLHHHSPTPTPHTTHTLYNIHSSHITHTLHITHSPSPSQLFPLALQCH